MKFKNLIPYDIRIEHTANNAIIVVIGCAKFAFTSPKDMLLALANYYANPDTLEKEYNEFMITRGPQNVPDSTPEPTYGLHGAGRTASLRTEESIVDEPDVEEAPILRHRAPSVSVEIQDETTIDLEDEVVLELNESDLEEIINSKEQT